MNDRHEVVVIGGGQAGLATGHHLRRSGVEFVILDAENATGDQWRRRWDSLRLFTPAKHATLAGLPWDVPRGHFPTRDETAAYLERYAREQELPIRHGVSVTSIRRVGERFALATSSGHLDAAAVVVATGANGSPRIPELALTLDPRIVQVHSRDYRNPDSILGERVLVVGYGTSGAEIALELALAGRDVTIAGKPTPHPPNAMLAVAGDLWWLVLTRVLSRRTPIGRRVAPHATAHGAPLIRISPRDLARAGVRHVERIDGTQDARPAAEGAALAVDSVVWCTGFRGDFGWIDLDGLEFDARGYPVAPFGLVEAEPGLGFVGLPFQSTMASALLGGVSKDAATVVDGLTRQRSAHAPVPGEASDGLTRSRRPTGN